MQVKSCLFFCVVGASLFRVFVIVLSTSETTGDIYHDLGSTGLPEIPSNRDNGGDYLPPDPDITSIYKTKIETSGSVDYHHKNQSIEIHNNTTKFSDNQDVPDDKESFHLRNLNLTSPLACGQVKCFVRLKKIHSHQQVGYLIEQGIHCKKRGQRTWDLADHLSRMQKISTLLLGQPEELNITEDIERELNSYIPFRQTPLRISHKLPLFVQKTRTIPDPSYLLQMTQVDALSQLEIISREITQFVNSSVKDSMAFYKNFLSNLADTKYMLTRKIYFCLKWDFQVMIDSEGVFHHIDLDRCFQRQLVARSVRESHVKMRFMNRTDTFFHDFFNTLESLAPESLRNQTRDAILNKAVRRKRRRKKS